VRRTDVGGLSCRRPAGASGVTRCGWRSRRIYWREADMGAHPPPSYLCVDECAKNTDQCLCTHTHTHAKVKHLTAGWRQIACLCSLSRGNGALSQRFCREEPLDAVSFLLGNLVELSLSCLPLSSAHLRGQPYPLSLLYEIWFDSISGGSRDVAPYLISVPHLDRCRRWQGSSPSARRDC
jgi:hypothetical protein